MGWERGPRENGICLDFQSLSFTQARLRGEDQADSGAYLLGPRVRVWGCGVC